MVKQVFYKIHIPLQNGLESFYPEGVRDYIHVVDLAAGHVVALKKFDEDCGCKVHLQKCHIYLHQVFFTLSEFGAL